MPKLNKVESEARKDLIDMLMNIMRYNKDKFPTLLTKNISLLKKEYTYLDMLNAVKKNESSLIWAIENKTFKNEYNKINYIFAIIKNNILGNIVEIDKIKEKQKIKEDNNFTEIDILNSNISNKVNKKIDMSEYLD